jgi:hypothetical protein
MLSRDKSGRGLLLASLAALCLLGVFSTEIADTDFWWHLKTGQYVIQNHTLPVPDPFAYTPSPGATAYFNLTHEWLSQVILYATYAAGGFPAVILLRGLLLTLLCGLSGVLAARASRNVWTGLAAALATASIAIEFTADRPAIVTFLGVALFITLLEFRRALWILPLLSLLWANCHGGFFLGWIVLLAYCAEAAPAERRRLWLITVVSIAASALNPNGYRVLSVLMDYRQSAMTANLVEWHSPSLWGPPYTFDILFYAAAVVLILSRKQVRLAHWLLFAAFASAALMAFRNILLIGLLGPFLIASYFPFRKQIPRALAFAVFPLLLLAIGAGVDKSVPFQLRVAEWTTPSGAAGYLLANRVQGPLFNTYEQGGYLIWRLAPPQRVFIDGRALSESAYRDYRQILYNQGAAADEVSGPRADLLTRYGVEVVVMNAMDWVSGSLYPLALALANPANPEWQLVYEDPQSLIFLRNPSPGTPVLPDKLRRVLLHLDAECEAYVANSPTTPWCARTLADYWLRNGVQDRARRMLTLYLSHAPKPDPKAEQALRQLNYPQVDRH